ncbi:unnamed protein product [Chrysoparadoxa australica]
MRVTWRAASAFVASMSVVPPGTNIKELVTKTAAQALSLGSLKPLATTFSLVQEGGMEFVQCNLCRKTLDTKRTFTNNVPSPAHSPRVRNPFAPGNREDSMHVLDLKPDHCLVLNKFPVVKDHALIITDQFKHQETALTASDLECLHSCVINIDGIGFFNGGPAAGASQRHKHMQLLPNAVFQDFRPSLPPNLAVPVNEAVLRELGELSTVPEDGQAFRLEAFPWRHAMCLLPQPGAATGGQASTAEHATFLEESYNRLIDEIGYSFPEMTVVNGEEAPVQAFGDSDSRVGECVAYNLLMMPRWMMVVGRSLPEEGDIESNGMGYIGTFLSKDEEEARRLVEVGPMAVLRKASLAPTSLATAKKHWLLPCASAGASAIASDEARMFSVTVLANFLLFPSPSACACCALSKPLGLWLHGLQTCLRALQMSTPFE